MMWYKLIKEHEGVSIDTTQLVSISQNIELLKSRAQELSYQTEPLEWKPISEWDDTKNERVIVGDAQQTHFGGYRNTTSFIIRPAEDGLVLE